MNKTLFDRLAEIDLKKLDQNDLRTIYQVRDAISGEIEKLQAERRKMLPGLISSALEIEELMRRPATRPIVESMMTQDEIHQMLKLAKSLREI